MRNGVKSKTTPAFQSITWAVKLRVGKANALYDFMVTTIGKLTELRICWTVENPWTSFLWQTSFWKKHDAINVHYCELHNCMFGGSRLKRTCLASNNVANMALNVTCDGRHDHAPWSITHRSCRKCWPPPSCNLCVRPTILPTSVRAPRSSRPRIFRCWARHLSLPKPFHMLSLSLAS